MRRLLVVVGLIVCMAASASAKEANWIADPVTSVYGRMGATKAYTFSGNDAVTLETMYVTGWVDTSTGGNKPIGAIVSVETYGARWSCGGGTPTTDGLGHLLAVGSSFIFNTYYGENCKFIPKTAGEYPLIQITPLYSK